MMLLTSALLCFAAASPAPAEPVAASEGLLYAIRARTVHVGGGETIENGIVVVQNDKILAVGKNVAIPQGAVVIEHDGALSAGLVALHGYAGTTLGSGAQTFTFNVFGEADVTESWKQHVHGHVEVEEPGEEVIVDRGEEVAVAEGVEHDAGHDEAGHEHGGALDPDDEELDLPEPILDAWLFAAREVGLDTTRSVIADAETAHAFNPASADFRQALEAGITTLVLTPDPQSLAPGQTAVVKTSGRVLERHAHLSLGFHAGALQSNRYPTSLGGAVAELDQRFAKPEGAFKRAAAGELPVLFEVASRQDVVRAAEFAKRHELKGVVNGADRVGEVAEAVKGAGLAAVVGPFPIGSSRRALRSVVDLAQAGVPFGFGLDVPRYDPSLLRLSAAACVREGLARDAAWTALTDGAARIAGVDRKVGRLASGLDADLVLWSGDPLDLASRPVTVIVDGKALVEAAR